MIATIKSAQAEPDSDNENDGEVNAEGLVGRDEIFGVAEERLELSRWTRRRKSQSARQLRNGFSSILFSSVGAWRGSKTHGSSAAATPSQAVSSNDYQSLLAKRQMLNRLEYWIVLLLLSCVCLSALYPTLPDRDDRDTDETLLLCIPSISIALSFFGYFACLMPCKKATYVDLTLVSSKQNITSFIHAETMQ